MAALLSLACWYFHISRITDRLGYYMGRGVVHLCWTCLETCLELPKSCYLVSLYSDLMDQFEGSQGFNDHQWNSSAARESSHVIILKSHLNSTGHSACTSKVCDIFDHQTYLPNDSWCARTFSLTWDRRNSMTAPVRNIGQWNPKRKKLVAMVDDLCQSIFNYGISCISLRILKVLYSHEKLHIHLYMQKHNDAIKTSGHTSLETYTSHFIWKVQKGL